MPPHMNYNSQNKLLNADSRSSQQMKIDISKKNLGINYNSKDQLNLKKALSGNKKYWNLKYIEGGLDSKDNNNCLSEECIIIPGVSNPNLIHDNSKSC